MNRRQSKIKAIITCVLLLAIFVSASCAPTSSFDRSLDSIVEPYTFSIAQWELRAIPQAIGDSISGQKLNGGTDTVLRYFSLVKQISTLTLQIEAISSGSGQGDSASLEAELQKQKAALAAAVESIIGRQIKETLVEQGIFNPIVKAKVSFPPLNFTLDKPPQLLVISPRDRIETVKEITLKPDISLGEIENIEDKVSQLGVSSLGVGLGGFGGTFPTFVADNGGLRYTIDVVIEEWLHQYLTFTPLGFAYLLDVTGVSSNYEIATMDETVASMVSKEIGAMLLAKFYPDYVDSNQGQDNEFSREMRQIRKAVDEYLAQGEIEQAERFMEEKRQHLASKGYYIRKLNQAYFAFYGTYADSPTSISPIGVELKQLREQSTSVKDFLDKVSRMTSRDDLRKGIE